MTARIVAFVLLYGAFIVGVVAWVRWRLGLGHGKGRK